MEQQSQESHLRQSDLNTMWLKARYQWQYPKISITVMWKRTI